MAAPRVPTACSSPRSIRSTTRSAATCPRGEGRRSGRSSPLLVFGIAGLFVTVPHANLIWSIAGLVILGRYAIFDFNRLRRAGLEGAVAIAASIFLDVLNVFLFFLELFGGGRE